MQLKHFLILLSMVVLVQPQVAYCQENNETDTAEVERVFEPFQQLIDSYRNLITPDSPDSTKAKYYFLIAGHSAYPDTIIKYANLSLNLCEDNDYRLLSKNTSIIGRAYLLADENSTALPFYQKALDYAKKSNNLEYIAEVYHYLAYVYNNLNNPDSAVICITNVLEIGNRLADTTIIAGCYQELGEMYTNRELYEEAKVYFNKALLLDSLSNNLLEYAFDLYRLADIIETQKKDSISDCFAAIDYLSRAETIFDTVDDPDHNHYKYYVYYSFSSTYIKLAQLTNENKYADNSLYYYKKAEPFFNNSAFLNIYRYLKYIYIDYLSYYKKYSEAIGELRELETILDENTPPVDYSNFHRKYKEICLMLGDYKNAYFHLEKQYEYGRANLNDSTMSAMAEVKAQQVSMMEKLRREKDEEIHASEKQKMRIVIISLIGGLLLISLLVFYIFRALEIKKKANAELLEKNTILFEQKEEITAQRDEIAEQKEEIEAQRDEIMAQRDHIEEQRDEIMAQRDHIEEQRDTIKAQSDEIQASISYAQRIQRSMLTPSETISHIFPDHFLLYKPRNIVSGDYYWVGQFGDNKVCIVADCTGHGVPGGFMSVLGMSNLNHIVGQDVTPDMILNRLREEIIVNLRQSADAPTALQDSNGAELLTDNTDRSRDGMDVAAYVVNERLMKLSFAGANNPLVLIRNNEVQVLKADKMPVGIYARLDPFQCTTIDIQRGDCLYTFSDGFQDQFGYESGKKFMSKRLRELLLEIHQQPMAEQKAMLNTVYEEWRGPVENQTDDVVVMGVRI